MVSVTGGRKIRRTEVRPPGSSTSDPPPHILYMDYSKPYPPNGECQPPIGGDTGGCARRRSRISPGRRQGWREDPKPDLSCRSPVILVDQPAEHVSASNLRAWTGVRSSVSASGAETEPTMKSEAVVMVRIGPEHPIEVPASEDGHPIQTLGSDGPNPSLGEAVRVRCADRGEDHLDPQTSSNEPENFESRSWIRNRTGARPSGSMDRFLACWVTQAESGWAVETVTNTRRVCSSMKRRT